MSSLLWLTALPSAFLLYAGAQGDQSCQSAQLVGGFPAIALLQRHRDRVTASQSTTIDENHSAFGNRSLSPVELEFEPGMASVAGARGHSVEVLEIFDGVSKRKVNATVATKMAAQSSAEIESRTAEANNGTAKVAAAVESSQWQEAKARAESSFVVSLSRQQRTEGQRIWKALKKPIWASIPVSPFDLMCYALAAFIMFLFLVLADIL